MSYDEFLAYTRPRLQASVHPFRQLVGAASNQHSAWSGGGGGGGGVSSGSGHSGYGVEHPDYDYHSGPPANPPTGGGYSYHPSADTGYGVPAPPPPQYHPPPKGPPPSGGKGKGGGGGGGGGKKGSSGSSAMTALTLLSFFFFVNLLQTCIKDHMDAMNPTVMVMTTNIRRNGFNKMGEMNSREQSLGVSSSHDNTGANIVMQPADLLAAAAANSAAVMQATKPELNIPSPYSGISGSLKNPYVSQQNYQPAPVPTPPPAPPQVYPAPKPEPENYQPRPEYNSHPADGYQTHNQNVPPLPPPQQAQYFPQPQPPPQSYSHPQTYSKPQTQYQQPIEQHQHPPPSAPPIFLSPQVEPETHFHYPPPDHHYGQHPSSVSQSHHNYPHQSPPLYTSTPPLTHQRYTTPRNPFNEYHQNPPSSPAQQIYQGYRDRPQHPMESENNPKYLQNSGATSSQDSPHGPVPWSSHSSSVLNGPFRRASIVAVTPSPKWVSLQSIGVNDHTDFETDDEDDADTIHNDRYGESEVYKKH